MGAHEEEHSTIAYYRQPGRGRLAARAVLRSTRRSPRRGPRYEAEVLAFHESVPGHHLQIAIAQELTGLPAFRAPPRPDRVRRGLGAVHRAAGRRDGPLLGRPRPASACCRSTPGARRGSSSTPGIHALGWTRAAGDRVHARAHGPRARTTSSTRSTGTSSGRARRSPTRVGQLEILRLRDEARARLGPAFDIRAFHDTVLGEGALALPTLRAIVDAWVTPDRARAERRRGPRTGSGRPRGRSPGAAQQRDPQPGAGLDDRHGRRLGAARGRAAGRLRRGRCRRSWGSCRWSGWSRRRWSTC